ncbi:MAG: glutathione S-transferase [Pseudomonadales bacterium]
MLKIYHVPGTRSVRVIWLCEELDLDYEVIAVDFSQAFRASPEWRARNPVGKVPVLEDGALTMFKSGAMVQYLLDRYGNGALQPPRGTQEHALFLQWCWFAEATWARPLGEIVNHRRALPEAAQSAAAIREMQDRANLCAQAVDQALAGRSYLLGDSFTAADVMTGYTVMLAKQLVPEPLPDRLDAYWQRLSARPAFQIATARS